MVSLPAEEGTFWVNKLSVRTAAPKMPVMPCTVCVQYILRWEKPQPDQLVILAESGRKDPAFSDCRTSE